MEEGQFAFMIVEDVSLVVGRGRRSRNVLPHPDILADHYLQVIPMCANPFEIFSIIRVVPQLPGLEARPVVGNRN